MENPSKEESITALKIKILESKLHWMQYKRGIVNCSKRMTDNWIGIYDSMLIDLENIDTSQ